MASSPSRHPPWSRAHIGWARPTSFARAVVLAAILAGVVALSPVARTYVSGTRVGLVGNGGMSGPITDSSSSTDGAAGDSSQFATTPAERTGLAFLTLDDPLERAVSTLGPPDRQAPDMNAALTHTWELAPGAELNVTADDEGIIGLAARMPANPPIRIAAHGGIIIGESTPAEITERWGDGHEIAPHPGEDFVLRYIECAGPFPVVIKFDQHTTPAEAHWNEPVTSVLIAYADAEPGTAGCPAT